MIADSAGGVFGALRRVAAFAVAPVAAEGHGTAVTLDAAWFGLEGLAAEKLAADWFAAELRGPAAGNCALIYNP